MITNYSDKGMMTSARPNMLEAKILKHLFEHLKRYILCILAEFFEPLFTFTHIFDYSSDCMIESK